MKLGGEYAVHLSDDHGLHTFLPGDEVPDWAAKRITNPLAWAPAAADPEPAMGTDAADAPPPVSAPPGDGPPPQGGAGASRQKWADYATAKGVTVEADWKREDIIAACEKAGVPV